MGPQIDQQDGTLVCENHADRRFGACDCGGAGRQARERAVTCIRCRTKETWNVTAICSPCSKLRGRR